MADIEMGRVSVMLPTETIEQIDKWAVDAGLKRGQFTSTALVIGSRILARQLAPEAFMPPEAWRQLAEVLGVDAGKLQEALKEAKS